MRVEGVSVRLVARARDTHFRSSEHLPATAAEQERPTAAQPIETTMTDFHA